MCSFNNSRKISDFIPPLADTDSLADVKHAKVHRFHALPTRNSNFSECTQVMFYFHTNNYGYIGYQ